MESEGSYEELFQRLLADSDRLKTIGEKEETEQNTAQSNLGFEKAEAVIPDQITEGPQPDVAAKLVAEAEWPYPDAPFNHELQSAEERVPVYTERTMNPRIVATSRSRVRSHQKGKRVILPLHRRRHSPKSSNALLIALLAFFGVVFLVSGVMLARTLIKYKQAGDEYNDITQAAVTGSLSSDTVKDNLYLTVDHATLEARNEDYIGWISIPGTVISYPVVRAEDYWEYLYTTFDQVQNNAGCIFADYQCANDFTSRNTILYGHRMNDGSMFGSLKEYFDPAYFEEHKEIHIYVSGQVLIYKVFSVYQAVAADESYTVDFDSVREYEAWLDEVAAKSVINAGVAVDGNDRVLMLSTCKGGDNNDRTVLFAVLKRTIPN